jgi:hypothetical protein
LGTPSPPGEGLGVRRLLKKYHFIYNNSIMLYMNKNVSAFLVTFSICHACLAQDSTGRWKQQRAWDWYNKQPWLCGFNYMPAYAINYTAMWDKTTFDAAAIDKELALAENAGYVYGPVQQT